jgi:hypothetical protein
MDEMADVPWWKTLLKYFAHGLAFSLLMAVMTIIWAFMSVILIMVGAIIGLILGFILLLFIVGGLNTFLTDLIWAVPIKTKWTSLLGHGFVLLLSLVVIHLPALAANYAMPGLATQIVLFIVYAFVDGFVAKKIAENWEESEEDSGIEETE